MNFLLNSSLRSQITSHISQFSPTGLQKPDLRHAAVAITIVNASENPDMSGLSWNTNQSNDGAIILTRRSSKLNKHAGQWALPGGRIDQGETPEQSALRELSEEVNLFLDEDAIIGRLDDYSTRSGFNITPIVVWGGSDPKLQANPDEVASIHRIPLSELIREDAPMLESIPESEHPVMRMPIGDSWIAAPTAAMIYQFREVGLMNRHTPVSHFEQPYFAWK